jgi:hypothetical protein
VPLSLHLSPSPPYIHDRILPCDHSLLGRVWSASLLLSPSEDDASPNPEVDPLPLEALWRPLVLSLSAALRLSVLEAPTDRLKHTLQLSFHTATAKVYRHCLAPSTGQGVGGVGEEEVEVARVHISELQGLVSPRFHTLLMASYRMEI